MEKLNEESKENEEQKSQSHICKFFKELVDFSLLRQNKIFLLIVLSNFFVFFAYYITFIYIPIRAQSLGINEFAWIISIMGIANIPMRIFFGFMCDKKFMKAINMNTLCLLLAIFSLFSYFFLTNFALQIGFAIVFSIPMAGLLCLSTPYTVEIVGASNFRHANGILSMSRGFGAAFGPFFAGFF